MHADASDRKRKPWQKVSHSTTFQSSNLVNSGLRNSHHVTLCDQRQIDTSQHDLAGLKDHFKGITMCYVLNLTFFKETAEHDVISRQLQHAREFFMLKVYCDRGFKHFWSLRSRNQQKCLWTATLINAANVSPISDGAPWFPGALSGRLSRWLVKSAPFL